MSIDEFDRTIPVKPPTVNKKINPKDHNNGTSITRWDPLRVANHLNTFTPVGMAMTIVAAVK
jgi:hypothetical protein